MSASELPSVPPRSSARAEEQASLGRVATLVAGGAGPDDVFAAVAGEVAQVLRPRLVQIFRWEGDGTATVVGTWGDPPNPFPVGSNWPGHEPAIAALVADAGRDAGSGSALGAPIVVEGEAWGLIGVGAIPGAPLPDRSEDLLAQFAALVATSISNRAAREQLARLAGEQAALQRVATLVARGAPAADVFEAVVEELGRLLEVGSTGLVRFGDEQTATVMAGWGRLGEVKPVGARLPIGGRNVVSQIARTGRPARMDDFERAGSGHIADHARSLKTRAAAGSPVVVAGRLWGAMIAAAVDDDTLPPDAEARLGQFTELIGAVIANAEARVELARLADEQAALRRVATLVAEGAPAAELFARVAEEVAGVFGQGIDSAILRLESDATATVVAVAGKQPPGGIRVDERLPVDGSGITARVLRERRPVRIDDYGPADGGIADHARTHGIRSAVGCPIPVPGRVWGAMLIARYDDEPFPADAERRVAQFTDLVATALADADARGDVRRLADEQTALRRVATLVAEGAAPTEVFDAAIVEVAQLLGAAQVGMMRSESPHEVTILAHRGQDPAVVRTGMRFPLDGESVTARVLRTGRSARLSLADEHRGVIAATARHNDVAVTVGAPITVEGALWGAITASWAGQDVPPADAEERLAEFAQLLGTAIANADSRDQLTASRARVLTAGDDARRQLVRDLHDGAQQRLVQAIVTLKLAQLALSEDGERAESLLAEALDNAEQGNAELRELAHGILPSVLTRGGLRAGVDSVVSRLSLPVDAEVTSERLPPEIEASAYFVVAEALTNVVKHSQAARAGVTVAVDNDTLSVTVRDDGIGGADPEGHGLLGIGDRVAALGGQLRIDSPRGGGTVLAAQLPLSAGRVLAGRPGPSGIGRDITERRRIDAEQAALRRVATLVAQRVPSSEVFEAVAREVAQVTGSALVQIQRYEPDDTVTVTGAWGAEPHPFQPGTKWGLEGSQIAARIKRTGRAVRIDDFGDGAGPIQEGVRKTRIRGGVGAPIVVEGELWGAMAAGPAAGEPVPAGLEDRLAEFTELVATAIANAESRAELRLRAEEQAALRRVATLVAEGVLADELLAAVAHEIAANAPTDGVHIYRYEPDGAAVLLAAWTTLPEKLPLGTRHPPGGYNIPALVYRSGAAARIDDTAHTTGTPAEVVQRLGVRSVVGCPIVVEGRRWGVVVAASAQADPIPPDTEERIARFTELVATAIANADSRAQLAASRARVVAATTEERRRIVRDVHDGAQQRLVHAAITLQLALRELEAHEGRAEALVREALDHTNAANSDLRELVHGILPRVLTRGGLRAGVNALAARSSLPVTVDVGPERYPSAIEATAYFVVSEALTNAVKHSGADSAEVTAGVEDGQLRVEVRDDGVGGADPSRGSGLTGLRDRVEALGGSIEIASPPGAGTSLVVRIPIDGN